MRKPSSKMLDIPQGDLWFKVTGMLNQNWAQVVEEHYADPGQQGSARILFFDDHGCVFDELKYPNPAQADRALSFNGFTALNDQPGFRAIAGLPRFPLTRSERENRPVYSSGEYWRQPPHLDQVKQRHTMTPKGLERFEVAQAPVMDTVLEELRAGKKRTHWMWFVFPQLHGLGQSSMSQKYGIVDTAEADDFLANPVLGTRLRLCFELVLGHPSSSAQDIFGHIDAKKFHSCATLFERVDESSEAVFQQALDVFFAGKRDRMTLELL